MTISGAPKARGGWGEVCRDDLRQGPFNCLTVTAEAAEDEVLVAEVRCRNVSLFNRDGLGDDERRLDDLIIPSCSFRQEPSKQSPAFDCLWCVVKVPCDKLWVPDLRNVSLAGEVLVLRIAWRGCPVAKSTLVG